MLVLSISVQSRHSGGSIASSPIREAGYVPVTVG